MITRNEDQYLEECLASILDFVDEIIIIDTGSTDKTKEIARKYTQKIYDYVWHDDFSAPRNEALKHATGEWILVLDADEILPPESKSLIRNAISNGSHAAYYLPQVTFTNIYTHDPLFVPSPITLKEKNFAGYIAGDIIRLFRNQKEVTYDFFVHETVEYSLRKHNLSIGWLAAPFLHLHELKGKGRVTEKQGYYAQLSLKNIEKYPEYGKHYYDVSLYHHAHTRDDEMALTYAQKAVEREPQRIEFCLNLSFRLRDLGRRREAIAVLLPLLKIYTDERVFVELGDLFTAEKDKPHALAMYTKALQLNSPRKTLIFQKREQALRL